MTGQTEIIDLKVSDKVTIKAEAVSLGGEERVGVGDILDFEGVTDAIEAIAHSITHAFNNVKPKKASVEFSLKVGVESGKLTTLLVKGQGEGTLKVTLEWGGE
jgi:hypothetical protein